MTEDMIIHLGQESLKTAGLLSLPLLGSALVVGLLVSVFQAITQINEATLTFIPKILVIALVLILAGPWMLDVMSSYSAELFENLSTYVRQ
ncbi:MAG: flagellar biosynthesis protein FliQ [Bdellovibrionales bacterium]|nr:flagellar biosynthesis protein FliQ [Bdellovibrionales bacterium]